MNERDGWFERWLVETGFVARYPQYAGALSRMIPTASVAVDTMAVAITRVDDPTARVLLLVNLAYFEANPSYFAGILHHEVRHVALGHLHSAKLHAVRLPKAMEIAMEVSANEDIRDELPGGVHLAAFAHLGLRAGQSTLQRYALLAKAHAEGRLDLSLWPSSRMLDAHRPRQDDACRGTGLGDSLDARSGANSSRNWNRGLGAPSSADALARMREAVRAHLRGERGGRDDARHDPARPRVARELDRIFVEVAGRRELDWARVLAQAFPRRRAVQPDYLRPNRRFPERLGEVPGRARRPPRPSLFVVVDTSGSMGVQRLGRIAREIRRLARYARITVAECDAAVHRVYPLAGALGPFVGGGDTDFAPAFEEAGGARRHEAVVYFTDGRGAVPAVAPSVPTLWVLGASDVFDATWGVVARMSDDA